jgi:hypothetical protein
MKGLYRIVSPSGLAKGTQVFDADGNEVRGIMAIQIDEIRPGGMVTASITVLAALDVVVQLGEGSY